MEDTRAFDGDPSWRAIHHLRDGSVLTIRAIRPEDRDELRRGYHQASPRTRYMRFLGLVGELTEPMLTYLTCVDQTNHVALVATIDSPDLKTERGVGVARFIRIPSQPDVAEGAITVIDDMQQKGVGTALAEELGRAAVARGVHTMRAEVLEGNAAMRGILEALGATRAPAEGGTIAYDISLDPLPPMQRLVGLLRGAAETMAMSIRRLAPPDHESAADAAPPQRD